MKLVNHKIKSCLTWNDLSKDLICSNQTHIKVWTLYTNNCSFMYVWEIKLLAYEVFPILNQELSKP